MTHTQENAKDRIEREAKESMIPDTELFASFDAQVWAREFVKHNLAYHIGLDEGTLTAWFASALMRGYDEHRWRTKGYKRAVRQAMYPWWSWRRYLTSLSHFGR